MFVGLTDLHDLLLKEIKFKKSSGSVIPLEYRRRFSHISLDEFQKVIDGVIYAVFEMLCSRDPYTANHQQRVARLALAIACELGFTEWRIAGVYISGLLHDVGKVGVPSEILSKPGSITESEFEIIKSHCRIGADILSRVDFPWPVTKAILQHHERLDGSGYPQGLKGDEIMLEARILVVADVVEAMASHRPYRPGLGLASAMDEIRKNRGRFYDPEVVDACVRLFEEGRYPLPEFWSKR